MIRSRFRSVGLRQGSAYDLATQHALDSLAGYGFMPRGHCYLRTPELLWTYAVSESVTFHSDD
jgi:hypothetical protein